mgnify:CR=1 FL=1
MERREAASTQGGMSTAQGDDSHSTQDDSCTAHVQPATADCHWPLPFSSLLFVYTAHNAPRAGHMYAAGAGAASWTDTPIVIAEGMEAWAFCERG